jgi:hypothetical protein
VHVLPTATAEAVEHLRALSEVPCWIPSPMPPDWTVTGLAYAGDERSRGRAAVLACAGPAPLGGVADMLLVAEEPGVGLGAGYAGLDEPDPGPAVGGSRATSMKAGGHPTALWVVPSDDDRCVAVGEAAGLWLWAILWPAAAGYVLAEDLELHDLRESVPPDLVVGAPSPYLMRRGR